MESLGLYLLKSAVWLTGFAIVFLMVLRNERYFRLNRIYLLSGIIVSIVFPFFTWHYAVILPSVPFTGLAFADLPQATAIITPVIPIYWWFYLVGIVGLALRLFWQTGMVIRKLRKAGYVINGPVKLVRTSEYAVSFSFFSFVFVNPSTSDIETKEIVNHESEHIQQWHWFDLLLIELLCMLQWFNPFVWIYARLIRQNHEYLADEMALRRTSNPAIYQATLLNQMFGGPVISLANSFSYSLNKKRFKMMKKSIDSPFRKLKMLLVLPLIAMVFYAFAKPEYISLPATSTGSHTITTIADALNELKASYAAPVDKSVKATQDEKSKIVKGKVVNSDGKPLHGTSVILVGSSSGTMTDNEGHFELKDVPNDGELTFSFVGYTTVRVKADFKNPMTVRMISETVGLDKVVVVGYSNDKIPPPPPLPPPPSSTGINNNLVFEGLDKYPDSRLYIYTRSGQLVYQSDDYQNDWDGTTGGNASALVSETCYYVLKLGGTTQSVKGFVPVGQKTGFSFDLNRNPPFPSEEVTFRNADFSKNPPLVILDGVIIDKSRMDAINPETIASINVLKDKSATDKYGEKAKNGVLEVTLKKAAKGWATPDTLTHQGISLRANSININANSEDSPLIILDGVNMGNTKLGEINPDDIARIDVLKDATNMYGDKAKNGAIQIFTKGFSNNSPLIILDGVNMGNTKLGELNQSNIKSITVLEAEKAKKYGDEAKDGVLLITSKGKGAASANQKVDKATKSDTKEKEVFIVVEEMPEFPGGNNALRDFVVKNIKYPAEARKVNAQGSVFVSFVVNSKGKVESAKVVRGVHPALDAEAMRVIGLLPLQPDWKPGKQRGVAVDVAYTLPIEFTLQ